MLIEELHLAPGTGHTLDMSEQNESSSPHATFAIYIPKGEYHQIYYIKIITSHAVKRGDLLTRTDIEFVS